MRVYMCPKCSALQDNSRMPPEYLWTLAYTFRCQNCATMLKRDDSLHRWIGFSSLGALAVALVLTINIPPPDYDNILLAIIASFLVAVLLAWCIPRRVVIQSEE